jgi:class 3 adenylate cyclase
MTLCTLCGRAIAGSIVVESELPFDSLECVSTYRKLVRAFGSNITETGLPSGAFTASFFFTDIVALSNPSLSVGKQIQKIEALNKLIASCEALRTARDKRIILPTGDGMAIGFLLNPDLPLELSMELHKKLNAYNETRPNEDNLAIRIGLASGSVYQVTDLNNAQNVWGPGIILARRVMDAGDEGHILLSGELAEELVALKDEYRAIIRPICDEFEIKHGQKVKLYSAYSGEFGNPHMPAKLLKVR